MRVLSGILFVVGLPWAFVAIFGLGGPAAAIEDLNAAITHGSRLTEAIVQIPFLLLFTANTILGYCVWFNWGRVTFSGHRASTIFWVVAAIHHLVWVGFAVHANADIRMPVTVAMFWHASVVATVCGLAAFYSNRTRLKPIVTDTCPGARRAKSDAA